jgi:hypothetical protein
MKEVVEFLWKIVEVIIKHHYDAMEVVEEEV